MTYLIAPFESGSTDGTTATGTLLATGATSGMTLTPTTANTGSIKMRTTNPHRGSLAVQCDAPAHLDVARIDITMAGSTGCVEPYIRLANYPTVDSVNNPSGEQSLLGYYNGTTLASILKITAAGKCRLYDATGQALWLSTNSVPLNAYVRYSLGAVVGSATTSPYNGTLRFQYFSGANLETSTPDETAGPSYSFSETSTAANTGTASFTQLRVGKLQSAGIWTGVTVDDLQVNNASSALIGAVTGSPPSISFTQTNQVKIDASASSGSPTLTLVQQSGPTVTITGPVSGVFTVTLPTPLASSAVVRLSATNGAGSAPPQDITISPSGGSTTVLVRDALYWTGSALA